MPEKAAQMVLLSLGSNSGPREEMILAALDMLDREEGIVLVRVSALYETEPVGNGFGGDFVNAACIVETCLEPRTLLGACKGIERAFGRSIDGGMEDRPLDIDIIVYADRMINQTDLVVPHRAFRERLFVLEPLCEIAPDLTVPPDGMTVREIRTGCGADQRVRLISTRSRID
ncbi:MAG TPA: 2-amino-4-hydroxy-6-hydroxymethyldihydropteridine diphosphokinase [Patescibacteria group bacterium]|nr:2-amino-4-hydroxy-6-hydroxymethyldihydropteridine diphosphokinase [Patescibacteria group bacterium]